MYLKIKNEPLFWNREKEKLADYLLSLDYRLDEIVAPRQMQQKYLPEYQGLIHESEQIAVSHILKDA